jgi:uncharacterized iron-regulated protein
LRPSKFQADIHKLQLELYAANQRLINDTVEGYTDEFRRYESRYRRTVDRVRRPSTFDALLRRTLGARAVLVGDYHTLKQSQRAFFRILRKQPVHRAAVIVALEMLPGGHERIIDRFVSGRISEDLFLKRIGHARRWPFGSIEPVRPIFDLARERSWKVIGVDRPELGSATLAERDAYAAQQIVRALEAQPDARVFVLIGEMHLAPMHLPRVLQRAFAKRRIGGEVLRVHQNPERIWFDLDARGLTDEYDVLDLADDAFALLSASPVVCQQSFLTWLDQVQDGAVDTPLVESDAGERSFRQALHILGRALRLPVKDALRNVEVVGPADLSFFERLKRSGRFSRREMKQIREHILSSESYYIPKARIVYLATLSLNHAAEEASHYLRHHLSHEGIDDPKGLVDAFYCRVMNEALGFMGSKIVNPKRKCVHLDELEDIASAEIPADDLPASAISDGVRAIDREAARFAIAHKRMERGEHVPFLSEVFTASSALFNAVTHILGYILGDQLYYALIRGRLSRDVARRLYFEPFEEEGAALMRYLELAARIGRIKTPKRT